MRISFSQVFATLLTLCSAVALLHVSIALGAHRETSHSPRTTQTVRSYYAAFNSFIAGHEEGAVPWTSGRFSGFGSSGASIVAGAFRATYPDLRLEPGEVSVAGDLAMTLVAAIDGEPSLPAWINDGIGNSFPDSIDSIRIENGQVVQVLTSAQPGVLAQSVAGQGMDFRIDRASRLKVFEIELSAPGNRGAFVSVSGPGFVLPVEGTISVSGNGMLAATHPMTGSNQLLASDEKTSIQHEEILEIPHGQAVIWRVGPAPARLILFVMVPVDAAFRHSEGKVEPRGPETFEDVVRRLTVNDGGETMWFGTIRALAVAGVDIEPGWLSMEMTRVLVPAGEHVRLRPLDREIIALQRAAGTWHGLESLEMINRSSSMWIVETVSVCWRGPGNAPQNACASHAWRSTG